MQKYFVTIKCLPLRSMILRNNDFSGGTDPRKLSKYSLYGIIEPLTYIANHGQCLLALFESAMTMRIALKISLCPETNRFVK